MFNILKTMQLDLTCLINNTDQDMAAMIVDYNRCSEVYQNRPWLMFLSDVLEVDLSQETKGTNEFRKKHEKRINFVLSEESASNKPIIDMMKKKFTSNIGNVVLVNDNQINIYMAVSARNTGVGRLIALIAMAYPMFANPTEEGITLCRDIVTAALTEPSIKMANSNNIRSVLIAEAERLQWRKIDQIQRLDGFIEKMSEQKQNELKLCVNNTKEDIKNLEKQIFKLWGNIYGYQAQIALKQYNLEKEKKAIEDLKNYLRSTKVVKSFTINDMQINFEVEDVLRTSDLERLKHSYKNGSTIEKILCYCVDPDTPIDIRCCGKFYINLYQSADQYCFGNLYDNAFATYGRNTLPTPHISFHNCWGTARTPILKALNEMQYVQVLLIACNVSFQLTWSDSVVCSDVMNYLEDRKNEYFYVNRETGQELNYYEMEAIINEVNEGKES